MENNNCGVINIFEYADSFSALNPRFTSKSIKCRRAFTKFMEVNHYFGIVQGDSFPYVKQGDAERIRPNIELWVRSYASGDDDKLRLLTNRLHTLFPETGELFVRFIAHAEPKSSIAWKLADYLCYALNCEISVTEAKELDKMAADMDSELPLFSARLFSNFLMYAAEQGVLSNAWIYQFKSRGTPKDEGAYSTMDFLRMAHIVFNNDAWEGELLLEKALQSEKDANLWLFVSCHFICGWRGTDIVRLPMPELPDDIQWMREQIRAGCFDTESILSELEFRLRYTPLIPQKTKRYENVPELKLFVPESLRRPFGIIYAVAASHHPTKKPGEMFVRKAGERPHIMSFFGNDFSNACGIRGFSSRRAVKSYLQGIEAVADSSEGRPKGYMLAALARSHKGGIGSLPKVTDIYLRDAKFSGYRPEFIAREMFERGVFSFIPSLMLEMYASESYRELPVAVQTKLLGEIGIEASGIEGLAKSVEYSLIRAQQAIAEIMKRPENIRGSIADILQNIASGNAPGKQNGFLCLMTASGFTCAAPLRSCCIGCGYEIYTKTILHSLAKEYGRLKDAKKNADSAEAARCAKMLKEAVMPAIDEIFTCMKQMHPDVDVKSMVNVVKMGAMLC